MKITLQSWIRYKDRMARIDQRAADELTAFVQRIGGYQGHEEETIEFAYGLATRYGEAAAAAACEMYDSTAKGAGVSVPPAEPADTATYSETAKAVRGAAKRSDKVIPQAVSRLVKQAGADTVLENADRDGAQFAWIPAGDTCAFCLMLASRGWQYQSKKAMKNGHAEHIHANCDCQYAVRFVEKGKIKGGVEGYDPDRYLEMYDSAEGDTWQEKVNAMRREIEAGKRAEEEGE